MSATGVQAPVGPIPILDRLVPLPGAAGGSSRRRVRPGIWIGLGLALAAIPIVSYEPFSVPALQWIVARVAAAFPGERSISHLAIVAGSFLIAIPLAIAIHEIGHALGGLSVGFRLSQVRIGPLQIDRPFRVTVQKCSGTGYLGWVSMVPVAHDRLLARAMVLVFAGPGINLLCAGVMLALPFPKGPFSASFILVSLALAVKELVPVHRRIAVSDGRRLWLLIRNPQSSRRWLALLKLGAELREGVLPESLSRDFLEEAVAYRDETPDTIVAHATAHAAAFHQHDDAEAARFLETCLQYAGSAAPALLVRLTSEAAVFQARRRKRADLAEQWLADMPRPSRTPWLRWRAEAAIQEARGDVDGALAKLKQLEEAFLAFPDLVQRKSSLRLLERWRSEIGSRARQPS